MRLRIFSFLAKYNMDGIHFHFMLRHARPRFRLRSILFFLFFKWIKEFFSILTKTWRNQWMNLPPSLLYPRFANKLLSFSIIFVAWGQNWSPLPHCQWARCGVNFAAVVVIFLFGIVIFLFGSTARTARPAILQWQVVQYWSIWRYCSSSIGVYGSIVVAEYWSSSMPSERALLFIVRVKTALNGNQVDYNLSLHDGKSVTILSNPSFRFLLFSRSIEIWICGVVKDFGGFIGFIFIIIFFCYKIKPIDAIKNEIATKWIKWPF